MKRADGTGSAEGIDIGKRVARRVELDVVPAHRHGDAQVPVDTTENGVLPPPDAAAAMR